MLDSWSFSRNSSGQQDIFWEKSTTKITIPGKHLIQNWWRNIREKEIYSLPNSLLPSSVIMTVCVKMVLLSVWVLETLHQAEAPWQYRLWSILAWCLVSFTNSLKKLLEVSFMFVIVIRHNYILEQITTVKRITCWMIWVIHAQATGLAGRWHIDQITKFGVKEWSWFHKYNI